MIEVKQLDEFDNLNSSLDNLDKLNDCSKTNESPNMKSRRLKKSELVQVKLKKSNTNLLFVGRQSTYTRTKEDFQDQTFSNTP